MANKLGLVHVYTGDGKGKTSAAMGLAMRAIGQGCRVFTIQFMKGGAYTGEMVAMKNFLPNNSFEQYGRHCIKEQKQLKLMGFSEEIQYFDYVRDDIECGTCRFCFLNDELQQKFVNQAYDRAKDILTQGYDVVVLDEVCTAVAFGFLAPEQVVDLVKLKSKPTELIMTGRGSTKEIHEVADYVTNMTPIKHPMEKGIYARRGVEY